MKWTIKVKSESIVDSWSALCTLQSGVLVLMCGTTLQHSNTPVQERRGEEWGGIITRCNTSRGQPGVNISEDKHLFNLRLAFKLSHSLVRPLN